MAIGSDFKRDSETYTDAFDRIQAGGPLKLFRYAEWLDRRAKRNDYPVVARSFSQQARYIAMRLDGTPHSLAEMFALGMPPMSNTDREFLEGHCNGSQFAGQPGLGDYYAKVAAKHGQNPTGKIYLSGLAAFPGDPEAFVSGRGDVARVLDKRGWGAEGSVNRKVTKVGRPLNKAVADDLVEEAVDNVIAANPGAAEARREDLAETVTNKMKPHWAKG